MARLRSHLTYANVMVTLLAFVVLCGGTAFAVVQLGRESVGTKQLKRNAVTGAKVKDGSLRLQDIKGLTGPSVESGPPGPAGPSGAGPAFQAHGSVNYDKLSASFFGSTVVTLEVPPGSYFVTAPVTVQNVNATPTDIQCRLINSAKGATVGIQRSQAVPGDGRSYSFTLTGLMPVAVGQAFALQCSKSDVPAGARINDANIVAVQVQSISGPAQ